MTNPPTNNETPRCPKCGSEMVMANLRQVYASLDAGPAPDAVSTAYHYDLRCILDPDKCRVKELERRLDEKERHLAMLGDVAEMILTLQATPDMRITVRALPKDAEWLRAEWRRILTERDTAQSALRASEARELVLREALDYFLGVYHHAKDRRLYPNYADEQLAARALSDTSTAAQEAVRRIERGGAGEGVGRNQSLLLAKAVPTDLAWAIRAAILGEKEP